MAIIKSKELKSGITGEYWRILSITFDRENLVATAQIGLFKDKAASDAGKTHLGLIKNYRFSYLITDLSMPSNIITFIYTKIVDIAETEVSVDITGEPLDEPGPFDPDIAGGVMG